MRILCAFCKGQDQNNNDTLKRVVYKDKTLDKITEGLACPACMKWVLSYVKEEGK